MSARLLSFVIWGLVAASAVFWANRFMASPIAVPAGAQIIGPAALPAVALTRLFGTPPAPQAAPVAAVVVDPRLKLIGVIAPRSGRHRGVALIATDDRPARAVEVGGRVDAELVVLSVSHRQVELGPRGGPAAVTLSLPILPEPARGVPLAAPPQLPGTVPGTGRLLAPPREAQPMPVLGDAPDEPARPGMPTR